MTERRLAAIVATDVVGYSRLIGADEEGTRAAMRVLQDELWDPKTAQHKGRVVKTTGDGQLLEFPSVVDAVRCSVEIQQGMAERNARLPEDRRIELRIGVNLGDIIVEGDDIHGDGVNVAARLEALAEPGDICISRTARDQVRDKLEVSFEDLGEIEVKNIARPIRTFRLGFADYVAGAYTAPSPDNAQPLPAQSAKPNRLWQGVAAASVVIAIGALYVVGIWQPWVTRVEAANVANMAFPLPDKPSIAVLPFDKLSGDPEQEFLADGFSEDLTTAISRLPQVFVISRTTTQTYKGRQVTVKQIAEELGVQFVLEGSVQRDGDQLRVNAQLIDALSGRHVWAEKFDRNITDFFAVKDEITLNVVSNISAELGVGEIDRATRRETENLEAWLLYRQGVGEFRKLTPEGMLLARKFFEAATDIDPGFATSVAYLAWTFQWMAQFRFEPTKEALATASEIAGEALELDAENATAFLVRGQVHATRFEPNLAVEMAEAGAALDPNNFVTQGVLGGSLVFVGRAEEGILRLNQAMRLSPVHPDWVPALLGDAYLVAGRAEEARTTLEGLVRGETTRSVESMARIRLALIYAANGQEEEARQEIARSVELFPQRTISLEKAIRPFTDPAIMERRAEVWRRLGLPE